LRPATHRRGLGYLVDASRGLAGGYRLAAGATLPPLLLDDDEAVAIAVGMRIAATSAIAGIEETSVQALSKLMQLPPSQAAPACGRAGERIGTGERNPRSDRRGRDPHRPRAGLP